MLEMAVLTDGGHRGGTKHQSCPLGQAVGESWHLVFGVGKGAGSAPPDRHRHLLHDRMFALRHLEMGMHFAALLLSEEKHRGFLNQILLGVCLFPLNILALSSTL